MNGDRQLPAAPGLHSCEDSAPCGRRPSITSQAWQGFRNPVSLPNCPGLDHASGGAVSSTWVRVGAGGSPGTAGVLLLEVRMLGESRQQRSWFICQDPAFPDPHPRPTQARLGPLLCPLLAPRFPLKHFLLRHFPLKFNCSFCPVSPRGPGGRQ